MRKPTDDLEQEIARSEDLESFLRNNQDHFEEYNISAALNQMRKDRKLTKSALAKNSEMSEVYLHQIFAGRRSPSRNRLLCLCFGLGASLEETQLLLKRAGYSKLYPHVRRDAIVMYGLTHDQTIVATNDMLFSQGEECLF